MKAITAKDLKTRGVSCIDAALKDDKPLEMDELPPGVCLCDASSRDEILVLDREISGENRRGVLIGKLVGSFVYRTDGVVSGFYLPDLGEGLILARSEEAGIALMAVRHSRTARAVARYRRSCPER